LVIAENSRQDELQLILLDVSSKIRPATSLETEKKKLKEELQELINKVDLMVSQSELDVVKKCIAPINPTLASLNMPNKSIQQQKNKIPHNQKIDKQRKFVSTKRKQKCQKKMCIENQIRRKLKKLLQPY
jgi:hypothetical protein